MDIAGYRIDRVDPTALPEAEQEAIARLWQVMGKELLPEEPVRPMPAILARLRSKPANQWSASFRARDAKGNVVGFCGGGKSLNEPENAHLIWSELQVHPDHRRKGLGTALLREFVRACEGQHPSIVFMGMANDRVPAADPFLRGVGATPGLPMKTNQLELAAVHRGHKLGLWMKAAMLDRILRERPEAKVIRTGNANTNAQMLGINTQLGFKLAWQSTLWQVPIADVRKGLGLTEEAPVSR